VLACPAERACVRLEHLRLAEGPAPSGLELTRDVAEPAIGHDFAALLDSPEIAELLEARHRAGASTRELRELLELIGDAYRWARRRRWTNRNPTADIALDDFTQ
jgi:hypothetical protein